MPPKINSLIVCVFWLYVRFSWTYYIYQSPWTGNITEQTDSFNWQLIILHAINFVLHTHFVTIAINYCALFRKKKKQIFVVVVIFSWYILCTPQAQKILYKPQKREREREMQKIGFFKFKRIKIQLKIAWKYSESANNISLL